MRDLCDTSCMRDLCFCSVVLYYNMVDAQAVLYFSVFRCEWGESVLLFVEDILRLGLQWNIKPKLYHNNLL